MAAKHQQFSDADKASALAALDANGGNVSRTAKQLGIPRSTLQEWMKGRVNHAVPELRQLKKAELSERLEELAHKLVDSALTKSASADATIQQVATSLGIVVDKMQLLKGKPTDRTEVIDNSTRAERINAILERGRDRRAGQSDSNGELIQ